MNRLFISGLLLLAFTVKLAACTSAIFTGKVTSDGRPLLWKNRDTDDENNRIAYLQGKKYAMLALLNSRDKDDTAWTGVNSVGFAIMNTASYNLKDDTVKLADLEGIMMYKALGECKNLADFEQFLDDYPRPMGVEANFGVIDAEGGAAYYEVNNFRWTKVDANDPKIAPHGYLVYTNFSYTGRFNKGEGYVRFQTASELIAHQAPMCDFTPTWIFNHLSRSFYNSVLKTDLCDARFSPENAAGWAVDQDFIPRKSTMSAIVIQGVKAGENPDLSTMWTILGYPPVGIAAPLWVKAGKAQPALFTASSQPGHAEICDNALTLKRKLYPITRGNGNKYLHFSLLYNRNGDGYMQCLAPTEQAIAEMFREPIARWRKTGIDLAELQSLNTQMESMLRDGYEMN
ncbi:MAG: hypothetical protein LBD53_06415 [Tannerella sp.]|jgi:hypothetical protein|nr:hypothetical protein [Tannerella sp.]